MTGSTRTPAQAAQAGGLGRPPASPPTRRAPARRNPQKICGSTTHQTDFPCQNWKGLRTGHPGSGRCHLHGGSSPSGKKSAERERVVATLEALAIPAEGDPLEVLQAAVEAAHGVLLAARELVKVGATETTLNLYLSGIERAARVAKSAAEAVNLDELVRIREREADLLEMALSRTLERFGIAPKRQPAFLGMFREELRGVLPAAEELS